MSKLLSQLKRHEGFRKTPYKCSAGKWTIGYGYNLTDAGIDHEGLVFNESYADRILHDQVSKISVIAYPNIATFKKLDDCRKDVITNMIFNMGLSGVLKFKRMYMALARFDYEDAANEMLMSRWAKQVGPRATELAEQMRTGEYQF